MFISRQNHFQIVLQEIPKFKSEQAIPLVPLAFRLTQQTVTAHGWCEHSV
jgi:hypothetical protein